VILSVKNNKKRYNSFMPALIRQTSQFIKSPLNYIGGKYKILNQILPLLPVQVDNFVDLFAGSCNVAVNVDANRRLK
jgi:hypothetical protein